MLTYRSTRPVITSVRLTLYSMMRPFWCSYGGGSQEQAIDLELVGLAVGFLGGWVGTGIMERNHKT